MRRSAAPSQLAGNAPKRPRFTPPVIKGGAALLPNTSDGTLGNPDLSSSRGAQDVLKLVQTAQNRTNFQEVLSSASESNRRGDASSSDAGVSICGARLSCSDPPALHVNSSTNSTNVTSENSASVPDNTPKEISSRLDRKLTVVPPGGKPAHHGIEEVGAAVPGTKSENGENKEVKPRPKFKPFRTPRAPDSLTPGSSHSQKSKDGNTAKHDENQTRESGCSDEGPSSSYYNVMWCKLSKKKHKKWEGDAILIARGRSVSLVDMEGKEIGKGTGYKTTEVQTLDEGQTLVIGGKEIEVMGRLSAEVYRSGQCFQSVSTTQSAINLPACTAQPVPDPVKPFVKPRRGSAADHLLPQAIIQAATVCKPRHDPSAPDALVLPRPSQAHQWEHNKTKQPLVDIVVDPYVSQHLRPHQRHGVLFLYRCIMGMAGYAGLGAILADEMGLGKTLQSIAVIWTLLKQGPYGGKPTVKRVLVITPGSLVKNWLREFKKWLGTERLKVFAVGPEKKVEEFVDSVVYPVMVISYEMFVRCIEVIRKVNFDLIVCDEGHRLKNTNIKTTTLATSLNSRRRIVLTGTPVQNDLQELCSIVDFCNPGILGSAGAFRRVYEEPIIAARRPDASAEEKALGEVRAGELNRITGMFILRRTQDINNKYLLPKVELVVFCRPSPLQLQLYRKLLGSRAVRSCLASGDAAQHLMCIAALKKLCNHPVLILKNAAEAAVPACTGTVYPQYEQEGELYSGLKELFPEDYPAGGDAPVHDSGKLQVVDSLLASFHGNTPEERVVLVSNYTQTLNVFEQLCRSRGYQFLRLDGQTPTAHRQQLVERFNNHYSHDFVFLLSSKAGGVGLNLIGASRLILYDVDWNPANDLQAMARVWRDGQKRKVYIYRLLTTGSIEEKMYQRQVSKQALSGVVVDAKSNSRLSFSPDELKDLFRLQEDTLCATHSLLHCTCADDPAESAAQQGEPPTAPDIGHRQCQLQPTRVPSSQRNLCMDELLEWKHMAGPNPALHTVDPLLEGVDLHPVTYAFWNVSNASPLQFEG